jgi:hypothetical protein
MFRGGGGGEKKKKLNRNFEKVIKFIKSCINIVCSTVIDFK